MTVSNEFTYRAKVKGLSSLPSYNRARFGISVGKDYHEGDKLRAAIDWARHRFDDIEVRVSDTLQRYNIVGDPGDNWDAARAEGDKWLERNSRYLNGLFVYRWEDVLNDHRVHEHFRIVDEYMSDPYFMDAMQKDIDSYRNRTGKSGTHHIDYLREELAVFSLLQTIRPAVDLYPGSFLECRKLLRPDFALARVIFERIPKQDMAA